MTRFEVLEQRSVGIWTVRCQPCTHCGKAELVNLTPAQLEGLNSGQSIQEVLPNWAPADRELLMTGIHPRCWDEMFPEEDEDD